MRLLKGHISPPAADLGSGDMYFTRLLVEKVGGDIIALDVNYKSSSREGNILIRRDISEIQPGSLGLITMLDVLEHVEDELSFLRSACEKLRPGGAILLTVPAHDYLFSAHDAFLKHFRRYDKKSLARVLSAAGLKVEKVSYFFLVPYIARLIQIPLEYLGFRGNVTKGAGGWNYGPAHPLTRLFAALLEADFYLGRFFAEFGLNLPGLSIFSICTKKSA